MRNVWIVGEDRSERDMLAALVDYLNTHRDVTIGSYNGRGFDLPVDYLNTHRDVTIVSYNGRGFDLPGASTCSWAVGLDARQFLGAIVAGPASSRR